MSASRSSSQAESAFALWSPGMASSGGVQSYMWRLWEMLTATESPDRAPPKCLSLVDTTDALADWHNETSTRPRGTAGSKFRFVRYALGSAGSAHCVIVGHLNLAPVAWLAWRLGRIDTYVVVLHGIEAWQRQTLIRRIALRQAHAVVATTSFTTDRCTTANGLPGSNFIVIPLCAEPVPAQRDPNFRLDGVFPILFVGRLAMSEQYKGLETLMAAVKRLIDDGIAAKLHVIGEGDDRPRLQSFALSLGLASHAICFHGRVSDVVLQAAYASAKAFVMPSENEGFGIVFLEAMRNVVACIGGAHGGTPEVIRDGIEGYLVTYGDVGNLAKRLNTLATDDQMRQTLAAAGFARFESDYQFSSFCNRWNALLSRTYKAADNQTNRVDG